MTLWLCYYTIFDIKELITELLLADDCALLAHKEGALQHIVNRFSDAAKNFGLTINLKKI